MSETISYLDALTYQAPDEIPTPRAGYVQLWRSIGGPVHPDAGTGETFSSNNRSEAQVEDQSVYGTEPDFEWDYNPFTKVPGLPVFLSLGSARYWAQAIASERMSRAEKKMVVEIGGVSVIGCAEVPLSLFNTGAIEVYHNECYERGGNLVAWPVSGEGIMEEQLRGIEDHAEHYVPNYPDKPASAGIETQYFIFDRYNLDGTVPRDARLIHFVDEGTIPSEVPVRHGAVVRPRYSSPSLTHEAEQLREEDPLSSP